MPAGESFKMLRSQLGLTTREVAELSRKVATTESNEEFALSHARLIQIENDESTPSVYKICTLKDVSMRLFRSMCRSNTLVFRPEYLN
jgi:transcriptional regulator with XRE-family HTH domain